MFCLLRLTGTGEEQNFAPTYNSNMDSEEYTETEVV